MHTTQICTDEGMHASRSCSPTRAGDITMVGGAPLEYAPHIQNQFQKDLITS